MFDLLAKIESIYDYTLVECRPYDPAAAHITARAFIVPQGGSTKGHDLPSERCAARWAGP